VLSWGSAGEPWHPRPPSRSLAAGGLRTEHPSDLVQLVHPRGVIGLRGTRSARSPLRRLPGRPGRDRGQVPHEADSAALPGGAENAFVRQIAYVPSGHLVINVVEATGDRKFGGSGAQHPACGACQATYQAMLPCIKGIKGEAGCGVRKETCAKARSACSGRVEGTVDKGGGFPG